VFRISYANFHEKALFVKADVAASSRSSPTASALRAMLPSALSVSPLSSVALCIMRSVLRFGLLIRRCNLPSGLSSSKGGPSSHGALTSC
jgi:hypothetical protein